MLEKLMEKFSTLSKLIALIALFVIAIGIWSMSFSHAYHSQVQAHLEAAKDVLVNHGLCKNHDDCTRNRLIFGSSEAIRIGSKQFGSIQIEVYGVSNMDIVVEIIGVITRLHKQHPVPRIQLDVYKSNHAASKVQFAEFIIK